VKERKAAEKEEHGLLFEYLVPKNNVVAWYCLFIEKLLTAAQEESILPIC